MSFTRLRFENLILSPQNAIQDLELHLELLRNLREMSDLQLALAGKRSACSEKNKRWITYPNGNFPALHRRKDYRAILRSEHAFRAAYAYLLRPEAVNEGNTYRFPEVLKSDITALDKLRKLILNPLLLEKRASLYVANDEVIPYNLVTEKKELAKKNPSGTAVGMFSIEAILPRLTADLGIKYEIGNTCLYGKQVQVYRFAWINAPMPYKIDPMPLPLIKVMELKHKEDVTLIAKDGSKLQAHRSIITRNETAITKCFSHQLKESETGTIQFPDYTLRTLQAYLACQYHGGNYLLCELINNPEYADLNIMELLSFAHTYEIQDLLNCCINYLALNATAEDCDAIEDAAKSYNLSQLDLLAKKLRHPQRDEMLQELMDRQKVQNPPPQFKGIIRI